tara:strand:- start:3426 stop:4154 length:729 start_codon:yes stop_codon:yes gene_type:complete
MDRQIVPDKIKLPQLPKFPLMPNTDISMGTNNKGETVSKNKNGETVLKTGGGTFIYRTNGSPKIYMTPKLQGLQFVFNLVSKQVIVNFLTPSGDVDINTRAAYDMQGNFVKGTRGVTISAGSTEVDGDQKGNFSMKHNFGGGMGTMKATAKADGTRTIDVNSFKSDIAKAIFEAPSPGATGSSNIASVVSPHIAIGDKKARKKYGLLGMSPNPPKAKMQKPTDNALNMKGTSIFGGAIKRNQ